MSSKVRNITLKSSYNSLKEDICVALLGSVGVGKSALMVKYITKRFIGEYDPCYEGISSKTETVDAIDLVIHVYDTYDKDKKNLDKYIKKADYLIVAYSITNYQSFLEAQEYFELIQELTKNNLDDYNNGMPIRILLLGTKLDLERHRQVNKNEVDAFIDRYSNCSQLIVSQMETTSCEEYDLVQNVFHKIVREIRQSRETNHLLNTLHITEDLPNSNTKSSKTAQNNKYHTLNANISNSSFNKRAKSPISNISGDTSIINNNNNSNVQNGLINSNTGQIYSNNANNSKDGSTKKNKFPFFTKILNKS